MIVQLKYYIHLFSSCSAKMKKKIQALYWFYKNKRILNNNMAELTNAAPANLVVYIILINLFHQLS